MKNLHLAVYVRLQALTISGGYSYLIGAAMLTLANLAERWRFQVGPCTSQEMD